MAYIHRLARTSIPNWVRISVPKMGTLVVGIWICIGIRVQAHEMGTDLHSSTHSNQVRSSDPSLCPVMYISHYHFQTEPDHGPTKISLDNWINGELYEAFPKVSSGALNEMSELKKKLAMIIVDDKERIQEAKHER